VIETTELFSDCFGRIWKPAVVTIFWLIPQQRSQKIIVRTVCGLPDSSITVRK